MNQPIDLVYLWCDGNDPKWKARKALYDSSAPQNADDAGESRFFSNDELRYSLRSVARYAPWIRRIFIVTDRQCPSWLDTSNPRIRIVDHSEIIPGKYLPLFNSGAIENWIYRIPDLAEHFLYANDDMFLSRPVPPSYFFTDDGRPYVRLKRQKLDPRRGTYQAKVHHMQQIIRERFHKHYKLAPHHNIDAYRKSLFESCLERYPDRMDRTSRHRFRSPEDIHRSLVGYYMLAVEEGVEKRNGRYSECRGMMERLKCFFTGHYRASSRCIPVCQKDFMRIIRKYNPVLFALNDDSRTRPEDRLRAHAFMESLFPVASPFEKDSSL